MNFDIKNCKLCPRKCRTDRTLKNGLCGGNDKIKIARAGLHYWEEPCISGQNGSGTVFFSGCSLKCCFCQNFEISSNNFGKEISIERLSEIFLELQDKNAENINLVNPTHYVPWIIKALDMVKDKLRIPVVYNSGGYENVEIIEILKDYIDIFIPDFKYFSSERSEKYSKAKDYFEVTSEAIKKMSEITGKIILDDRGIMQKGLIIRHLVMPTGRHDSMAVLKWISENIPEDKFLISLMSQYTPIDNCKNYPEINRKVATMEYNSVLNFAVDLEFKGFMQERSSAQSLYTPDFNLEGV